MTRIQKKEGFIRTPPNRYGPSFSLFKKGFMVGHLSFYEFKFIGTGLISLSKVSLKPPEWRQKWALRTFKTRSLRDWDLEGSKLKGFFTSQNQGNALRQDSALS